MSNEDLRMYSNIVYIQGLLLQARIELESMLVANEERRLASQSPAYTETHIRALINTYGIHHNALITNLYK